MDALARPRQFWPSDEPPENFGRLDTSRRTAHQSDIASAQRCPGSKSKPGRELPILKSSKARSRQFQARAKRSGIGAHNVTNNGDMDQLASAATGVCRQSPSVGSASGTSGGERERDNSVAEFGAEPRVAARGDNNKLAAARDVSHRRCLAPCRERCLP
jgi:hypothetical protein